jgi:hypothetical protein
MSGRSMRGRALVALTLMAIGLLPFLPLAFTIPKSHDLPDHLAMAAQFRGGLADGSIYPRWFGDLNRGWGEPTANYYPPGLYYLTALTTTICRGDLAAGLFGALLVLSAAGMAGLYRLLRPVSSRPAALLACFLYAAAPFRAFELYAAGLFSAYAAGCLVPWLLLSLWKLASPSAGRGPRETVARAAPFALAFALVTLVNLPYAVMSAYLAAAWAVLETAVQRNWRVLARVALGGAWGALLAGAFLIPATLELPLVAPPLAGGDEVYRANFLFISDGALGPGMQGLLDHMGLLQVAVLALGISLIVWRVRRSGESLPSRRKAVWMRLVACFGGLSFFLVTPASKWLWGGLPFLRQVYMPWRFLDLLALAMAAIGAGGAASLLARRACAPGALRTGGLGALGALSTLCVALSISIFHMNGSLSREDVEVLPELFYHRTGYFLPRGAEAPERLDRHPLVDALPGPKLGKVIEWTSERRRLQVSSDVPIRIFLRTYYFPGWTARTAAGAPLAIHGHPPTGRIEVDVPAGDHEVVLTFENTPVRTAGAAVTILAALAWAAAALITRRRPARSRRPIAIPAPPPRQPEPTR